MLVGIPCTFEHSSTLWRKSAIFSHDFLGRLGPKRSLWHIAYWSSAGISLEGFAVLIVGVELPLAHAILSLDFNVRMWADTGKLGILFEIMLAFSHCYSTTMSSFA